MTFRGVTVPQGLTQPGTNDAIVTYLHSVDPSWEGARFLDIGCGRGDLMGALRSLFPKCCLLGADIRLENFRFAETEQAIILDASQPFNLCADTRFDVITCVSLVGEFHDLKRFIENCVSHLNPGGRLIIANDNYFGIRDRLSFLLFGRLRRHRILPRAGRGSAPPALLGSLLQIYQDNGLECDVRYTRFLLQDLPLVLLACVLYVFQIGYLMACRSDLPLGARLKVYPFRSLLSRSHLVIGTRKCDRIP